MKALIALIILTGSTLSPNLSYGAQSCYGLLTTTTDTRPSYKLIKAEGVSSDGLIRNTKNRLDIHVLDESSRVVGELIGLLVEDLYYDFYLDISPPYQRRGISSKFFSMFFKKFKKSRPVRSLLIFENLEIFLNHHDERLSNEEAALATPHVKALTRQGFVLSEVFFDDEDLEVRVFMLPPQD